MGDKLFPVLEGNPDWMSRLPEELHDVPLWNLALPGRSRDYFIHAYSLKTLVTHITFTITSIYLKRIL